MKAVLRISIVTVSLLALGSSACATTLTFDSLGYTSYANFSGYQESGFDFTMTPGTGATQLHIDDGTGNPGTLNWHEGGDNGYGNTMVLTRIGGGLFDLISLHVDARVDAADGRGNVLTFGPGDYFVFWRNISSVVFSTTAGSGFGSGLDNVVVEAAQSTAVPEIDPAGFASVLALVTGALGLVERRRRLR